MASDTTPIDPCPHQVPVVTCEVCMAVRSQPQPAPIAVSLPTCPATAAPPGECAHGITLPVCNDPDGWCPACLRDALASVRHESLGQRKAYALLQKGMESQCHLMDAMKQELRAAQAKIERLRHACASQDHTVSQALAAALGYPRYCDDPANFPDATADGVFVGEHTAETLAMEAARRLAILRDVEGRLGKMLAEIERLKAAIRLSSSICSACGGKGHDWTGPDQYDRPVTCSECQGKGTKGATS